MYSIKYSKIEFPSVHPSSSFVSSNEISGPKSRLRILFRIIQSHGFEITSFSTFASDLLGNLGQFPKDLHINNTITDFTKFQIPKKGQTIFISAKNIAWYRRIITAYEGHQLEEKKDGIYIDKKKVAKYTFALNYYWLMGDNRYNSADSRIWGFVPEDHIVGRASLVWFSKSADPTIGIRWDRLFKLIE